MSTMNRREVLRSLLARALQGAGTVVLACSALPTAAARTSQEPPAEDDIAKRADRLASEDAEAPDEAFPFIGFRRGGFGNGGGGGGFRRGGFGNGGGGGGFRRGGFGNGGGGGGFRRGGFRN